VVGLGQTVCAPGESKARRRCGECALAAICRASSVKRSLTIKAKSEGEGSSQVKVEDIEDLGAALT